MAGTEELQQPKYVDFGEYILFQIRRTQQLIQRADLFLLLTTVAVAVLFLLLGFVVLDHWGFSQGLTRGLRWTAFTAVLGSVLAGVVFFLRTSAGKSVTELFAARTLEKADSGFSNHLLTLVDLDFHQRKTAPPIRSSLEKRAALRLNDLDVEHAVDRRAILHRIYALMIGIVLFFGYGLLAPKSVVGSLSRILLPWTSAAAPTQTRILDVQPGNTTVTIGSHVEISAYLDGKIPDQVWLSYSTADRRIVNERIELRETDDGLGKFVGTITGENGRGIDQPTTYSLIAGDGRSEEYLLSVKPAPSLTISKIRMTPPAYTGRSALTQQHGTLDALEGSVAEWTAKANLPITKAWIQLYHSENAVDRAGQLPLKIEGETEVTGQWQLKIGDDGTYPRFYRLECETADGTRDPSPPLHAILIRPDERPEVRFLTPTTDLERPVNVTVPLLIEARDPDFRLSGLSLQVEKQGQMISSELIEVQNQQSVQVQQKLDLSRLPVQSGEEITFWVEARDNREPYPNRRSTTKLRIRLTEPLTPEELKEQKAEEEKAQAEAKPPEQPAPEETPSEQMPPQQEPPQQEMTPEQQPQQEPQEGTEKSSSEGSEEGKSGETTNSESGDAAEKSQEQSGQKKSDQNDQGKTGENGEKPASEQSGSGKQEQPEFSPEGEDDDRVLEKMIERMREKQQKNSQNQSEKPDSQGDAANQPSESGEEQQTPETQLPGENPPEQKPQLDQKMEPGETGNEPQPSENSASEQSNPPGGEPQKKPADSAGEQKSEQMAEQKSEQKSEAKPDEKSEEKSEQKPESSTEENKSPAEQRDSMKPESAPEEKGKEEPAKQEQSESEGQGESAEDQKQAGDQPSEQQMASPQTSMEKKSSEENSQPGPGNQPDPDGKGPAEQGRELSPEEMKEGGKQPGEKPGQGDATPGKGDEQGPTERDQNPDQKAPQAEKPLTPPEDQGKPAERSMNKPNASEQPSQTPGEQKSGESSPSGSSSEGQKPGDSSQSQQKPGAGSESQPSSPKGDPSGSDSASQTPADSTESMPPETPTQKNPAPQEMSEKPDGASSEKPADGEAADPKPDSSAAPDKQTPATESKPEGDQPQGDSAEKGPQQKGPEQGGEKPSDQGGQKGQEQGQGEGQGQGSGEGKGESPSQGAPGTTPGTGEGTGAAPGMGEAPQGTADQKGNARGGQGDGQAQESAEPGGVEGGTSTPEPDKFSLEDRKKAAELVLQQLEEDLQRGDADPELLKELGWSEDNLKQFQQRMSDYLRSQQQSGENDLKQRQFEEMLKNMRLSGQRKAREGRTGGQESPDEFAPTLIPAPAEYREIEQAFQRSLLESERRGK